jgi:hypothetical protein
MNCGCDRAVVGNERPRIVPRRISVVSGTAMHVGDAVPPRVIPEAAEEAWKLPEIDIRQI